MKNFKQVFASTTVAVALLTACASGEQKALTVSGLDPAKFDTIINEKPVKLYTLKNQQGMEVCITNYGGRVVSLVVNDKDGKPTDVVLGFDNIRDASLPRIDLTTIEQPMKLLSSVAMDCLFQKIQNEQSGYSHRILYPNLVERSSCRKID